MYGCSNNEERLIKREKDMQEVIGHWNKYDSITNSIGKYSSDGLSHESLNIMTQTLLGHGMPFSKDVDYNKGQINRLKLGIDQLDKKIRKGTLGDFKLNFYVGESLSMKHPLGRSFYEGLNNASNFERKYQDTAFYDINNISSSLISAMKNLGDKGFRRRLQNIQHEYFKETARAGKEPTDAEERAIKEIRYEMEGLINGDKGAKIFRDFKTLVSLDKKMFKKANKSKQDEDGNLYDQEVLNAASTTREMLDRLGKDVVLPGLDNLYSAAVRKTYGGDKPKAILDKGLLLLKKRVDAAKARVEGAIKKGGYFPHIMLEDVTRMNLSLQNEVLNARHGAETSEAVAKLIDTVDLAMPDNVKARSALNNEMWNNDPIEVLNAYSRDIIAFNKINEVADNYLRVMPGLKHKEFDSQFLHGMRKFIDDQFAVSAKGFRDRPDWINSMNRNLLSIWTLKTMGLSTTGAARNILSGAYFFGGVGVANSFKARAAYNSGKKFGGDSERINTILDRVEEKQGFQFQTEQTMQEMVESGFINSNVDAKSIEFDPHENRISYVESGDTKYINDAMRWMLGKSLVMHRWGENVTRRALFRSAFIQSYEVLSKTQLSQAERTKNATNFALRTVNQFAFEYAPNAKARMVGGRAASGAIDPKTGKAKMTGLDYAAAAGQPMFQFMHFPMSFLANQARILKGTFDGMRSGQGISTPEAQVAMNFAGIFTAVQALSIAFGVDLNNILENDTYERIKNLSGYLVSDPENEGKNRGLLSEFTGPIPSDIMFTLQASALSNTDLGPVGEMLLGDAERELQFGGKGQRNRGANRFVLQTEINRIYNKIWPEMKTSKSPWTALPRHWFALYPNKKVTERRRNLLHALGIQKKSTFSRRTNKKAKAQRNLRRLVQELGGN